MAVIQAAFTTWRLLWKNPNINYEIAMVRTAIKFFKTKNQDEKLIDK